MNTAMQRIAILTILIAPSAAMAGADPSFPERSVALGLGSNLRPVIGGYSALPFAINSASLRVQLGPRLVIEPLIEARRTSYDLPETTSGYTNFNVGLGARILVAERSNMHLVGLARAQASRQGGGVRSGSADFLPDGVPSSSSSSWVALDAGLSLEYAPRSAWSISVDATTPLASASFYNAEFTQTGPVTSRSSFQGISLTPDVVVWGHVWY